MLPNRCEMRSHGQDVGNRQALALLGLPGREYPRFIEPFRNSFFLRFRMLDHVMRRRASCVERHRTWGMRCAHTLRTKLKMNKTTTIKLEIEG